MKPGPSTKFSANPLLVSAAYALISVIWIVLSDQLIRHLATNPDTITRWSILKGAFYVSLSAGLIYFLMERISSANRTLADKVKSQTEALRKSGDRYWRVLETAREGVWTVDRQGRTEYVNQALASMLGFRVEEMVGRDLLEYVDPDWQKIAAESFRQQAFSSGSVELKFRRKDGSEMWASAYRGTLLDEIGQYDGAVSRVSDISEQKRVEDELRLQATALTAAANAIAVTDLDGKILWTNPAFTRLTGYEPAEVIGQNRRILRSGKQSPAFYRELWSAILDGRVWHGEITNRHKDGRLYDEEMTIAPVRSPTGAVTRFIVIEQDVTARKQAQEALRRSEELFRCLVENSSDGIMLADVNGRMRYASESACNVIGYSRQELLGRNLFELVHEEELEKVRALFERIGREPGSTLECSSRVRHGDGTWRYCEGTATNRIEDPDVAAVVINFRDNTARKSAEEALGQAEAKYREIFENAVEGMCQITPEGRVLSVNQAFATMFGFDSPGEAAQHISDISRQVYADAAKREEIGRTLAEGGVVRNFECEASRRDGSRMWLLANVRAVYGADRKILCYEGTLQDITERKTLELQLRQAQRLEAVGRLAGGVAHDFNNLLGVIIGYGDILQTQLPSEHPALKSNYEIQKAARRAADLTRQLLAFSRKQILQPQVLNLNALLDELSKMLHRMIGEDVELVFRPGQEVARVKADPGQLEQVVMNLAVNAKDAMPGGGRLLIETVNVEVDEGFAHRHAPMRPGSYVMLSVTDTGCGMDARTLSQIFEPFYTTKEQGKGTGLGLSIVYGIVKQSGGYIWVDSEPNRGSAFRIYLPPTAEAETAVASFVPRPSSIGGTETILVVEDDPSLREMIRMVLTAAGYRILEAPNGAEALSLLRGTSESVQLLMTDIVMPGKMNGWELARSAAASKPAIRKLFMTGFSGELDTFGIAIAPDVMLITKPFSSDLLLRKVRETLDNPTEARSAATSL